MGKKKNQEDNILFYSEGHEYFCVIKHPTNGMSFIGKARCHPEDRDFESEKTGYIIAQCRAQIKALKHYKNFYLQPQLEILKSLYCDINKNKEFNEHSNSSRKIRRYIYSTEAEIEEIKNDIQQTNELLKSFLEQKDILRHKIRMKRELDKLTK
jgi:hypothetical protein